MERINLLLVEDEAADAEMARRLLVAAHEFPFALTWAQTLSQAIERLGKETFDAALLDLGLPDCDENESFDSVHARWPRLPIVVITSSNSEEKGPLWVRRGAQDFLTKGKFDAGTLKRTLLYAMERQRLLQELEIARGLADQDREKDILERISKRGSKLGASWTRE